MGEDPGIIAQRVGADVTQPKIVEDVPWINGLQVLETMEPAFRDNLGPAEGVKGLMSKYNIRVLHQDPVTTRRIDHVRADAGYRDLTCSAHDSVEECLVLAGSLTLDGEGPLRPGDYFWRPPGFVHCAHSDEGFEALLLMEGVSPSDGSGKVSRLVHPHEIAGKNVLISDDEDAIGPRGWVMHQPVSLLPWGPVPASCWRQAATAGLQARTLSRNVVTDAGTWIVRAVDDVVVPSETSDRERFFVVLEGEVRVQDPPGSDAPRSLAPMSLVHVPAHTSLPALRAAAGSSIFVKAGPAA
jgi:quercetin dioxygenase-like cupin family protein